MNFEPTEERRMLVDSLRRYLTDRYGPEEARAAAQAPDGFEPRIWSELAELGVVGALLPEEAGGFGGAGFDLATVFEELGRAGVVEPFLETAVLGGGLLAALGTEEQRALLGDVIAGTRHLALAHGEPRSRYDLTRVGTAATGGRLTGRKAVVAGAEAASHLVVSARTSGAERDADGISLFLVARDAPGLTLRGYPLTGGGRAAEVALEDTPGEPLGPEDRALPALEAAAAAGSVALAAYALGAMEAACEMTVGYLGQRRQFGRPLAAFQALQHRTADMLIELEQARSAVILAAGHLETPQRDRHVAAARHLVGRTGRMIAEESVQMHGGIGMTGEYALGHLVKRITLTDHRLGDADHHLERYIALTA
jgi:alkylation response protein AidB-like acyl-CoA dehydrogenase